MVAEFELYKNDELEIRTFRKWSGNKLYRWPFW